MIRKVEAMNSKIEAEWAALRDNSKLTPVQARAAAMQLLKQYGLQPHPHKNQDAIIHMQFNCDGTHIVSAENYDRFLEENL